MVTGRMIGADPAELGRLGQEMIRAGDDLDRRRQRLHRLVARVDWSGPVAERLRTHFLGIGLGPVVDLLRQQGAALREQAVQQNLASHAQGGFVMGLVETIVPPLLGASGPAASSPYTDEAFRRAGIDPSTWRPERGFDANRENIEKVYEYYTKLHLDHPELQWAGMAALVGPSFQAGFEDVTRVRIEAARLADALDAAERSGAQLPGEVKDRVAELRALAAATDDQLHFYETTLLDMQRQNFLDQATQHEAFLSGGLPAILELHDSGALDDRTLLAWELIERGRKGDAAALAEGNPLLVLREQSTVIDDDYQRMLNHDPPVGRAFTYVLTVVGRPSIEGAHGYAHVDPLTLSVRTPDVSIGTSDKLFGHDIPHATIHAPRVTGFIDTPLPAGNIANFDDRWRLLEHDTLPAYQRLLSKGSVDDILRNTSVAERAESRACSIASTSATSWTRSGKPRLAPAYPTLDAARFPCPARSCRAHPRLLLNLRDQKERPHG